MQLVIGWYFWGGRNRDLTPIFQIPNTLSSHQISPTRGLSGTVPGPLRVIFLLRLRAIRRYVLPLMPRMEWPSLINK